MSLCIGKLKFSHLYDYYKKKYTYTIIDFGDFPHLYAYSELYDY